MQRVLRNNLLVQVASSPRPAAGRAVTAVTAAIHPRDGTIPAIHGENVKALLVTAEVTDGAAILRIATNATNQVNAVAVAIEQLEPTRHRPARGPNTSRASERPRRRLPKCRR
jgi:hypothetical protein